MTRSGNGTHPRRQSSSCSRVSRPIPISTATGPRPSRDRGCRLPRARPSGRAHLCDRQQRSRAARRAGCREEAAENKGELACPRRSTRPTPPAPPAPRFRRLARRRRSEAEREDRDCGGGPAVPEAPKRRTGSRAGRPSSRREHTPVGASRWRGCPSHSTQPGEHVAEPPEESTVGRPVRDREHDLAKRAAKRLTGLPRGTSLPARLESSSSFGCGYAAVGTRGAQ